MFELSTRYTRVVSTAVIVLVTVTANVAHAQNPFSGDINGLLPPVESPTPRWFDDPHGNSSELGPVNTSQTKLGVIHTAPVPGMLATTNPNAQTDLSDIWLDTKVVDGNVWLYFAWKRDSRTGSGVVMYEFQQSDVPIGCLGPAPDFRPYDRPAAYLIANCNPWANRQPGDFIFVWDQQGKSTAVNIIKRTFGYNDTNPANGSWDGPTSEPLFLDAGVQLSSLGGDVAATVADDGLGGEAAINLSAFVFPPPAQQNACFTVGNVIPGTVTGNSDTADYKDTVLKAFTDFVNISNCGILKITKYTDPANDTGSFPFTVQRLGGGDIFYSVPTVEAPLTSATLTTVEGTFTANGESVEIDDLIVWPNPSYTLTEGDLSATAWQAQSIECTLENGSKWSWTRQNPDDVATVTFELQPSLTTECTIRNKRLRGSLRVIKVVINDNGGNAAATDFQISLGDGTNPTIVGGTGGSGALYGYDAGQAFHVQEIPITGYAPTYSGDCQGTIEAGIEKVCTITNDDIAPTIKLTKTVTNNNGGNASPNDFGLTIGGSATTSGATVAVAANTPIALNEAGLTGYSFVSIAGDAKCPAVLGGTVMLDEGEAVSCTITNDDIGATITLTKVVTNDNGGNASPNDFGLTIGGTATTSGATVAVAANTPIALNEAGLTGYTFVSITGDAKCPAVLGGTVTLDEAEAVSCTITNDDIAPTIRLTKAVTNDNGGNASPNDFGLTIGGTATTSGATVAVAANTPIALNEAGLTGYSFVSITGDAKCPAVLGGTVTLNEGEAVSCTITNDDIAPTITLTKAVTNNNGGNASPNDFGLTIGGTATTSGATVAVAANAPIALNEVGLAGYSFVSITGSAKCPAVLGGTVTLDEGESVSCTITNDDIAATIALTKVVVNDNGGDAGPNDFGLTIGGNPTTSGAIVQVPANTPIALNEAGLAGYSFVSITGDAKCPAVLGGTLTLGEGETVSCTITNDDLLAQPIGYTVQRAVLHDTFKIDAGIRRGLGELPMSVTFRLYTDDTCSMQVGDEETVPLVLTNAAGTASTVEGVPIDIEGTYYWRVEFSGNNFNAGFTTACGTETAEVSFTDGPAPQ